MTAAIKHTAFGTTLTLREWSQDPRCVIDHATLQRRISRNWDIEKALSQPHGQFGPKPEKSHCNIGPLSPGKEGRYHLPRVELDTPTRITNSSRRELYRSPAWPAPSNVNRRVA